MRVYKKGNELKELAELMSYSISVRTHEGGTSHDTTRRATKKQREILFGVIYGALLALNQGEEVRSNPKMEQAIIDAAEFQADILMQPYLKDGEELQGYLSVYIPLQRAVKSWGEIR